MRTLIIDNYLQNSPQTENLYNVIKDITVHTVEVKSFDTITSIEEIKPYDIVVLSGSQRKLADPAVYDVYSTEAALLREIQKPILGLCFGHQLISIAFGQNIISTEKMIEGYYMVHKVTNDKLFDGLGEKFLVMESHEEVVENLPYEFALLADSPNCAIEVIKHEILPIYGVQFHPERFDDKHPAGGVVLDNFFRIATL
jgi:GMP synthase-like glutamine amidotransferase